MSRAALLAETQEKSRRLEALARLAQGLTATLSGDQVLERVVGAAVELLGGSMARLWLLDDDGQRLTLGASAGQVPAPAGLRSLAVGEGLVGLVVARGTPITMPDVQSDAQARHAARLAAEGIASAASVPLQVGARVLGALAVGTTERHDYTEEELSLLQSLANQAAIAIDNARLFFEEQTRRAYLNALLEINTKIGTLAPTDDAAVVHRRGGGAPAGARQRRLPPAGGRRARPGRHGGDRRADDGPPAPAASARA